MSPSWINRTCSFFFFFWQPATRHFNPLHQFTDGKRLFVIFLFPLCLAEQILEQETVWSRINFHTRFFRNRHLFIKNTGQNKMSCRIQYGSRILPTRKVGLKGLHINSIPYEMYTVFWRHWIKKERPYQIRYLIYFGLTLGRILHKSLQKE